MRNERLLLIEDYIYDHLSLSFKKFIFKQRSISEIKIISSFEEPSFFEIETFESISKELFINDCSLYSFLYANNKMLLASDASLIDAANKRGFQTLQSYDCGLPCISAMKSLDETITVKKSTSKLQLVISLDIDYTLIDFHCSVQSGKIVFQDVFIKKLFAFLKQYVNDPNVEIICIQLLTSRDQQQDLESSTFLGAKNVVEALCNLYKETHDFNHPKFQPQEIKIFYALEKYQLLYNLYGNLSNSIVVHFDDAYGYLQQFPQEDKNIIGIPVCGQESFYEKDLMKLYELFHHISLPRKQPSFFEAHTAPIPIKRSQSSKELDNLQKFQNDETHCVDM